jgi:hypothetical protein
MVIKIPNRLIIVAIAILFAFYCYGAFQFNNKVRIYNNKIQIGDSETLVWALLGPPSHYDGNYRTIEETSDRKDSKTRHLALMVYRGFFFVRSDLILIFDHDAGTLIEKSRGVYFSKKFY